MRFVGFVPGSPLAIVVSPTSAPLPMAPLGYGPAVLGPDVSHPAMTVVVGPLADGNGELVAPFAMPPALASCSATPGSLARTCQTRQRAVGV